MRHIAILYLFEPIVFRRKTEKVIRDIAPDAYQETEKGLFLTDDTFDIFVPWESIASVAYVRQPPLAQALAAVIRGTSMVKAEATWERSATEDAVALTKEEVKPRFKKGGKSNG